jgi:predicted Holliday junction resolvase-like endonuclease
MGNLDRKRKLENELNASGDLSEERKRALQEEMNRVQEKLKLKALRNKKNRKDRLKKAEAFMLIAKSERFESYYIILYYI